MTPLFSFTAPIALLTAALLACSPAADAKDQPAVALDASFKAIEMAPKVFTSTDPAAFKGLTRVAVPLFTVEFVTSDNVSAETSGFAAAGRASVAASYKLVGVTEADFQALTDTLYADFLRDLQASGLEVVPAAQLQASTAYRKLVADGTPAPMKNDNSIMLAPPGMAIYGMSKMVAETGKKSLFGAFAGLGAGIAAISSVTGTVDLQKELNAGIVEVQLRVHFVELTNNNKGFLGRLSNTASVSAKASPRVATAMLSVQTASTRSALTLQNALLLDSAAFSEVREEPKTAGDVAGGVAAALIRMASGSKDSRSDERYEAVADAARYREVVGVGLGNVREMLVERLKTAR